LLPKHLEEVITATATLRPRLQIMLTTNGVGLDTRAGALKRAGLDRINVSLDTVDAARFAHITRRDRLTDVLAGLRHLRHVLPPCAASCAPAPTTPSWNRRGAR
jgi:cyclic pyranopterin phosphate synthase